MKLGEEGAGQHSSEYQLMLSMRVCREYAGRQSNQVKWSMRQPTFKYKGMRVCRVYEQQGVLMGKPIFKVDVQEEEEGGVHIRWELSQHTNHAATLLPIP